MKTKWKQLFNIPNLLSLLRLMMIPILIALYLNGHEPWTAFVLVLSGMTDILDGYIARHYGMVTDLGKALDPIADKLTQAAMILCLTSRYPMMFLPFLLLMVKEIFAAVSGLIVIQKTGIVPSAEWHGKAATLMLYGMMILHALWQDIPMLTSNFLNGSCVIMMLVSFFLYARRNLCYIRNAEKGASHKDKGENIHVSETSQLH